MSKTNKTVYFAVFALAVALFLALGADIEANAGSTPEMRLAANLIA